MILLALAAATASDAPRPAPLRTFRDWIVGCDNTRACQANVLAPEGPDESLMVTISRGGDPADKATMDVPLPDKAAPGARFAIKVDGKPIVSVDAQKGGSARLVLTRPVLAALLDGSRLELGGPDASSSSRASLAGLAAALLYIDDQQHRIGTAGALKSIGARPDASVPAPPAPPVVLVPPPSNKPPRTISVAQATSLIGEDSAVCDYASHKVEPRAYRLDAGHSVVLVDHPCGNGAYNYFTSVYLLDESGPPREARFDLAPGMGEEAAREGPGELTNGDFDPKSGQLSSYEKGRGLGDCGTSETYAWDGRRFRLIEQTAMGECRGSIDYIRVWTAEVRPATRPSPAR